MKRLPPVDKVVEAFSYDPASGYLSWAVRGASRRISKRAGYLRKDGYIDVELKVDGHRYRMKAHNVAWVLHHGAWPEGVVDHVNGRRDDNRISNLRAVSFQQNSENRQPHSRRNRTGLLGVVSLPNGAFRALISSGGTEIHLGTFDSAKEAHAAYLGAKKVLHRGDIQAA